MLKKLTPLYIYFEENMMSNERIAKQIAYAKSQCKCGECHCLHGEGQWCGHCLVCLDPAYACAAYASGQVG